MPSEDFLTVEQHDFAPIDDTVAKLRAIPGINDNLAERQAALAQMESEDKFVLAIVPEVSR
ncbi:MAG: hypothetical protein LBB58_02895 [Cellulomonadaceae bacterium]|jgi:hypothetical protein|nr:hypothetical protein [Cellulomonadaceae bacterium]